MTLQQRTDGGLRQGLVRLAHISYLPLDFFCKLVALLVSGNTFIDCWYVNTHVCQRTRAFVEANECPLQTDDTHEILQLRETDPEYGAWAFFFNGNAFATLFPAVMAVPFETRFQQVMAKYQDLKKTVAGEPRGQDVLEALAAIDAIATECKNQGLLGAAFKDRIKGKVESIAKSRGLYRLNQRDCNRYMSPQTAQAQYLVYVNEVLHLNREPLSSVEVPLELTDGLSEQFKHLSWNNEIAVGRGLAAHGNHYASRTSTVGLHQLFPPVNGWLLQIRVTQHRNTKDQKGKEVTPKYEEGRIVYDVEDELIQVTIRNMALVARSTVYSNRELIDERLHDEELLIKVFEYADKENENGRATLGARVREKVTRTLKPGMICECQDKETQTCVVRIEIGRKKETVDA